MEPFREHIPTTWIISVGRAKPEEQVSALEEMTVYLAILHR
jgi:hypothetical protein